MAPQSTSPRRPVPRPHAPHARLTSAQKQGGILRATGYSLAFLVLGAPVLYVSYCETVRHSELRRRKARFESRREARRAKRVAVADTERSPGTSTLGSDLKVADGSHEDAEAGEEEKQDLRELFASVRIGGRYSNPFVEWREQVRCPSYFIGILHSER